MLYIGIDPGEAWCGFAALSTDADILDDIRAEARTYDVAKHGGYLGMVKDIIDLIPHMRETHIIVEDFRIRASGHQRFSRGDTLRFIGALEYATEKISTFHWHLVPPGNIKVARNLFGRALRTYRERWPHEGSDEWGHCVSAWRALGMYLLKSDTAMLARLRGYRPTRTDRWLPVGNRNGPHDFVAPAVRFRRRGQ
jgi:hypothetical protein